MTAEAHLVAALRAARSRRASLLERSLIARCLGTELVMAHLNAGWERALADGAQLYVNDGEGTASVFTPQAMRVLS